jgi:hypothetical protein
MVIILIILLANKITRLILSDIFSYFALFYIDNVINRADITQKG